MEKSTNFARESLGGFNVFEHLSGGFVLIIIVDSFSSEERTVVKSSRSLAAEARLSTFSLMGIAVNCISLPSAVFNNN